VRRPGSHSTLAWVTLAVLGLVVAVGFSYAASQLSKPSVGLSSEPVPGVSELAPGPSPGRGQPRRHRAEHPPGQPTQTAPPPAPPPTTTGAAPTPHESEDGGGEDD
jgi:hypothetical protein